MKRGLEALHKKKLAIFLEVQARKNKAKIWKYLKELLERPRRNKIIVNISKINKLTKEGDVVIVPGKVLGMGELDHSLTIAAFDFSKTAKEKLNKYIVDIYDLVKSNPKGSNIKIII